MKRIDVRGVPVLKMATTSKIQALKVLEEAAELVEAVKQHERALHRYYIGGDADEVSRAIAAIDRDAAIAEAADVITATVGLLVAMGCDAGGIADAMQECAERQERRGRE